MELLNPVSRKELLEYYNQSTFLFLHLNDLDAFKKVLPSKLFEYGAFDKPIIAGVGGYAAQFIRDNLLNYILFKPIIGNSNTNIDLVITNGFNHMSTIFSTKHSRASY